MRPRFPVRAALAIGLFLAAPAAAQQPGGRAAFSEALRDFGLALRGEFGDEGPGLESSLDAMRRALDAWDSEIRNYEAAGAAPRSDVAPERTALLHAALGLVYLDRGRARDARREIDMAVTLDPSRGDFRQIQALALRLLGEPTIDAYRAATTAVGAGAEAAYQLARDLQAIGRPDDGLRELERFVSLSQRALTAAQGGRPMRFLQVGLVPEVPDIEPFFPPARYARGFALIAAGDYAAALGQFAEALAGDSLASSRGAATGTLRRAGTALRAGLVEEALQLLSVAGELEPDRVEVHRMRGHAYLLDQQTGKAVEALRMAVRLDPADERAHLSLARALIWANDLPAAAQALTDALTAVPQSGGARYELGLVHRSEGRDEEAIAALVGSLVSMPLLGANSIHRMIGTLHRSRQRFDDAAAAFSRRLELIPNDAGAHLELGEVYQRLGRDLEALAEFAVAAAIDPALPAAHAGAAQIHLRQGRHADAIEASRRVLALDPRHREARYTLATALIRSGRDDDGTREMELVRQQQAEDAAARDRAFTLGRLRREAVVAADAGDLKTAIGLLQQVLDADPAAPEALLDLALALIDAGRHGDALPLLTQARARGAGYDVYRHLADAYRALGDAENSRRARALYEQLKRDALRRPDP
jgi:tetratricopeptide (TPR) repeat protein